MQTSSWKSLNESVFSLSVSSKLSTTSVVVEIVCQQENEGERDFVLGGVVHLTFSRVAEDHRGGVSTSIVVTGVHLVCVPGGVVDGCGPVFMVAPTNVECNISSHSPQSIYDRYVLA